MLVQRNTYRAVAVVEAGYLTGDSIFDPDFDLKQFAVVRSDAVLANVIAKLKLNESWGEKYNRGGRLSDAQVEKILKRRLKLQFVNNTHFLQIGVYEGDLNEAAILANTIAESYCGYQIEELLRLAAQHPNPRYPPGFSSAVMMDRAVAELKPVRPNNRLAGLMMIVGGILIIAGIITYNYSED